MPAAFGKRSGRKASVTAQSGEQRIRRKVGAFRGPVGVGPVIEFRMPREQAMKIDTVHPGLLQQREQPCEVGRLRTGREAGGHPFGDHGILVRRDGKEKLPAILFHLCLNVGKVRRNPMQLVIRKADAAVVVQGGAVIEFTAPAERDLLFRGSLKQLLIEKRAGGNQQRTQGKACADVVRRVRENRRVRIPVPVQKRGGARRALIGQQRGRAGNQHADRRDQTEQEENPDKQNR